MRKSQEIGFLVVQSKQTMLSGARESWGVTKTFPLCIVYNIPQHGTLFASQVELTLFLFNSLWGKELQIARNYACFDLPPVQNTCVNKDPLFLENPTLLQQKLYGSQKAVLRIRIRQDTVGSGLFGSPGSGSLVHTQEYVNLLFSIFNIM